MAVTWNINLGTILTLLLAGLSGAIWVNTRITELNNQAMEAERRVAEVTVTIKSLEQGMIKNAQVMDNVTYRMGQTESSISSVNTRMDRMTESFITSVEGLKKDVNVVNTQIQLLGQKVDALDVPRNNLTRKGLFRLPLYEGYTRYPPRRIAVQVDRPSP